MPALSDPGNEGKRMIGDYDEACDVVQEAFLSGWQAIGSFRGDARFSTWLCGIVLNHARDHLACRISRSRHEETSLDDPPGSDNGCPRNDPPAQEESVVERLEKREREIRIQACLNALDGEQREVLVLRDIQGFSYEEIGMMLKLPGGTVRSRIFRARNALKDSLSRIWGDLK